MVEQLDDATQEQCAPFLVLEALPCELCTGVLWELPYTDDMVLISGTLSNFISSLKTWKAGIANKELQVPGLWHWS